MLKKRNVVGESRAPMNAGTTRGQRNGVADAGRTSPNYVKIGREGTCTEYADATMINIARNVTVAYTALKRRIGNVLIDRAAGQNRNIEVTKTLPPSNSVT